MALSLPTLAMLAACILTGLYARALSASSRLAHPNQRSMHVRPVPSGAGVVIVAVTALMWIADRDASFDHAQAVLLTLFAALSAVSWLDDQYQLASGVRLVLHTSAAGLLLVFLPADLRVVPWGPLVMERIVLGVAWVWFINLFNFMDGIDGLAAAEAIAVAVGYAAVVTAAGSDTGLVHLGVALAAACAGYLVWNWHPARVFMGDAGSIPLGFLLGWLMIDLACRGHWAAALILPSYFVSDATLTLLRRVASGEKPWRPHRNHFYQRAVLGRGTAPAVVLRVAAANAVLIVLALMSIRHPIPALAGAAAFVAALLLDLQRLARL